MNPMLPLMASFAAGALAGLAFFWGLWLTVTSLDRTPRPALRMLGSLLLRFGLVLAGLYALARYGDWRHLVAAAAGFTVARLALVRRLWPRPATRESDR